MTTREPLFLDTSYVLASVNSRDQWHAKAKQLEISLVQADVQLVTTQFVLLEITKSLAHPNTRQTAINLIDAMGSDSRIEIVPCSDELFRRGLQIYRRSQDKGWSLVDSASFAVMEDRQLTRALSADRHFVQAGFEALMLD
jgi:uncharacterized protein